MGEGRKRAAADFHQPGRRIEKIFKMKKGDLGEAEYAHMRKVVGYVYRHRGSRRVTRTTGGGNPW
jgi:hypothetical protein